MSGDRSLLSVLQDPQVLVGVASILVAILLSAAAWWFKRKRISYRVHLDTPIGIAPVRGNSLIDVELKNRGSVVEAPSVALVRIMNTGNAAIRAADFEAPLRLDFAGRKVVDVEVIEADRVLRRMLEDDRSWPPVGDNVLVLPKVPLNRKHRIKLLVLLSGPRDPAVKPSVSCEAFLSGGRVVHDTTTGNGPSRRTMALAAIGMVAVSVGTALVVNGVIGQPPSGCGSGTLLAEGSTAFAPVAVQLGEAYQRQCDGARVTASGVSTYTGLDRLGAWNGTGDARIAMSDGVADPRQYTRLVPHQVGMATFAVVVNRKTGVTALTSEEIKDIFAGKQLTWATGEHPPITIVSRDRQSGTRAAFEGAVLGGRETQDSTAGCTTAGGGPSTSVARCELRDGSDVLATVNRTPGAIGYADVSAARKAHEDNPDVVLVTLDGIDPTDVDKRKDYRFRVPEFVYTLGNPPKDGLIDSFLEFLDTEEAKQIIADHGFGS
ncbi:substrate-binding domain-containing protein [Actinosynnema sp. NPDC020468]|uniref:substrate-binding domain-containing protein n=1 Tax=Actinosynnema sp. NPDC020468 TaxID=3154488 RepID=UPI0033D171F3